jgi:hypothetical protein
MNARKSKQQCHIDEMKVLAPDFVLNVGDLIEGYNDNWKAVESEWNYILGQQ